MPSPPAKIPPLVPEWRAARRPTPVGGTSSFPRQQSAGDFAPPPTASGYLLPNPEFSYPATGPVTGVPYISPEVVAPRYNVETFPLE